MKLTRREALRAVAIAGSAALLDLGEAPQAKGAATPRAPGSHEVIPLPFDPKSLRGLSERLLVSHHDNNYAGAVKNLNKVEEQLASVGKDTPGYLVAGLRERELTFTNSLTLHELYFANLGGSGKASAATQSALAAAFGDYARFEELLRATAQSLAGGSGWAVLSFCFQTGDLRIHGSANHTQAVAFGAPLLVLDMYEHAYALDFGAAAAQYIDAFFANVQWEEVTRRHERALAAAKALRA